MMAARECAYRDSLFPASILWERERAQEDLVEQERDMRSFPVPARIQARGNSCCYVVGCRSKEEEPQNRERKVHLAASPLYPNWAPCLSCSSFRFPLNTTRSTLAAVRRIPYAQCRTLSAVRSAPRIFFQQKATARCLSSLAGPQRAGFWNGPVRAVLSGDPVPPGGPSGWTALTQVGQRAPGGQR
jgi:hypothetical protein